MEAQKDPGFGLDFKNNVKRLINDDGTYNIKRVGGLGGIKDLYKSLIQIRWYWFTLLAILYYLLINLFFALAYFVIGVDQLNGLENDMDPFMRSFFFSIQTFSTIGYGSISPVGIGANMIATFEAFTGFVSAALITGLVYGRFSRPKSLIRFSKNVIITEFNGERAVMFKIVNRRNEILLNTSTRVLLTLDKNSNTNQYQKNYYTLKLQIDKINFFPLTWTLVHIVDSNSPLNGVSLKDLSDRNAEMIVVVESFDQTHQQVIIEKHSYGANDWIENVKFKRNFNTNKNGEIVLRVDELDDLIPNS
jgi:inward rectifier potassium channel